MFGTTRGPSINIRIGQFIEICVSVITLISYDSDLDMQGNCDFTPINSPTWSLNYKYSRGQMHILPQFTQLSPRAERHQPMPLSKLTSKLNCFFQDANALLCK